jgi:hypothetical protein
MGSVLSRPKRLLKHLSEFLPHRMTQGPFYAAKLRKADFS